MLSFVSGYDHSIVQLLESGFTSGFPVHFDGPRSSQEAPNLLSALQNPKAVSAELSTKLDAHRLAGHLPSPPFPVFRISPLGLVPNKVEGEFCLILHFPYPRGSSLNDGISSDYTTVSYVIGLICLWVPIVFFFFIAKADVKNAFRLISIHLDN